MPDVQLNTCGGRFQTADGYLTRATDVEVSWIWNGVIEGSRESVAEFLVSQLPRRIARKYGDHVTIHFEEGVMNPQCWIDKEWILHLKLEGASIHEGGDGAHMAICILLERFPYDLGAVLRETIQQLTWRELSTDYEL